MSRIGPMHRLAVVPQRLLGEPFRVAAGARPFRPRIAIGVQGDAGDAESAAALLEFGGPVASPHSAHVGEQWAGLGQSPQNLCDVVAEVDKGQFASLELILRSRLANRPSEE